MPVTYNGAIYWESHSPPIKDDDYNLSLAPPDLSTFTPGTGQTLGLEFDSDETIDHFTSHWWNSFHQAVDTDPWAPTRINGDESIVIGLLGLDCEHSCGTELHPVFGLAIHDSSQNSADDDVWAIFVRNWGDEGYCSSENHTLDRTSISFQLPWRPGADALTIGDQSAFYAGPDKLSQSDLMQAYGPHLQFVPQTSMLVTFNLPPARAGAFIEGELHIVWSGSGLGRACSAEQAELSALEFQLEQLESAVPGRVASAVPGVVEHSDAKVEQWHRQHDGEVERLRQKIAGCRGTSYRPRNATAIAAREVVSAESKLDQLGANMTRQQRNILQTRFPLPKIVKARVLLPRPTAERVQHLPKPQVSAAASSAQRDDAKLRRDNQRQKAWCEAFAGKIPGYPDACSGSTFPVQPNNSNR
jgi:hypothetical protein